MRMLVTLLAAILIAPVAYAHGGMEHVMGTVKSIDDKSITVAGKDGKETTVQIDASTKFEKGSAAATAKDVSAGERVVVHAKKAEAGLTAAVVKIGGAGKTAHHEHQGH